VGDRLPIGYRVGDFRAERTMNRWSVGLAIGVLVVVVVMRLALLAQDPDPTASCAPDFQFVEGSWPTGDRVVVCESDNPKQWPYKAPAAGVECVRSASNAPCPAVHVDGTVYPLTGTAKSCSRLNGWGWKDMPGGPDSPVLRWTWFRDENGEIVRAQDGTPMGESQAEAPAWAAARHLGCE
jgi:hypothetical protein